MFLSLEPAAMPFIKTLLIHSRHEHKLAWRTNTVNSLLPFSPSFSFDYEVQHPQHWGVLCHSLQSHPALPRLPVQGRTSKGSRENERGHFSLGPGVKLTGGLQALWTSDSSLICWITEWQSSRAGQIAGKEGGSEIETETENYIVKLKE